VPVTDFLGNVTLSVAVGSNRLSVVIGALTVRTPKLSAHGDSLNYKFIAFHLFYVTFNGPV